MRHSVQKKFNYKFLHAGRLRESEINFVFCERVPYTVLLPNKRRKAPKMA